MISKRNRRPGRPQENLRQFALNNSKGVDGTKSPTDLNTVSKSKNLIVNPDGSMSLRKPIELISGSSVAAGIKQYYLYDNVHKLTVHPPSTDIFYHRISISEVDTVRIKYTKYTGDVATLVYNHFIDGIIVPHGNVEVINLNSSSILGNCEIDFGALADGLNPDLVDDTSSVLPRYIRITCTDTEGWVFEIISPELNKITVAEGDIAFNPNLILDSPTALRDTYNAVVPAIKGILAYVPTDIVNNEIVPVENTSTSDVLTGVSESKSVWSPDQDIVSTFNNTPELKSTSTENTLKLTEKVSVTCGIGANEVKPKLSLNIAHDSSRALYSVSVTASVSVTPVYHFDDDTWYYGDVVKHTLPVLEKEFKSTGEPGEEAFNISSFFGVPYMPNCTISVRLKSIDIAVSYTCTLEKVIDEDLSVAELTESSKQRRYRIANTIAENTLHTVVLKAFCNLPKDTVPVTYCGAWFYSQDGIRWDELQPSGSDPVYVRELNPEWKARTENDAPTGTDFQTVKYYSVGASSPADSGLILKYDSGNAWEAPRTDIACINVPGESLHNRQYRFKIIAIEPLKEGDVELEGVQDDEIPEDKSAYRIYANVAQQDYVPITAPNFEFFDTDFGNPVYGNKLYHKKSIYSYGSEKFLNNIFVSDIDSFITPLYNIIDLDAQNASQATCLIPWRDYLVSATDNAMYLHTKAEGGYLTKTVNTSIGIPEEDSRCCKSILNGILFKSGPKIYQMYPNVYSGDDSTLNLTEISKAVEDYLEAYIPCEYTPFAFSTESEYILMLPNINIEDDVNNTICLRYNYSSKLWTVCTYPIVAQYYKMLDLNDIRIFGTVNDYFAEFKFDSNVTDVVYGDVLPQSVTDGNTTAVQGVICPIEFEWDTGQKTDNISLAKQFVESKLVFATEDDLEFFPMELTVHVDGDPHVTTLDVNSDAPFWKTEDSKGVANTAFRLSSESDTGVFRQLIVRYSGKGRSVRHILRGSPTSNFRLYETYVRYKTLNIKR